MGKVSNCCDCTVDHLYESLRMTSISCVLEELCSGYFEAICKIEKLYMDLRLIEFKRVFDYGLQIFYGTGV